MYDLCATYLCLCEGAYGGTYLNMSACVTETEQLRSKPRRLRLPLAAAHEQPASNLNSSGRSPSDIVLSGWWVPNGSVCNSGS